MADKTDKEHEIFCVLRAQSGSQEALNDLFKLLQEPLFRYIRSLVRDQSLSEDILQEVFIRIYRKLRWLREPRALRPWAYQIASREAFRYLNRTRRWSKEVHDEAAMSTAVSIEPPETLLSTELIGQLPELVEKLSPASRTVVVLYYLHDLSLAEIAAVLEIPLGTVKSRLAYGLNSLRMKLEKT